MKEYSGWIWLPIYNNNSRTFTLSYVAVDKIVGVNPTTLQGEAKAELDFANGFCFQTTLEVDEIMARIEQAR